MAQRSNNSLLLHGRKTSIEQYYLICKIKVKRFGFKNNPIRFFPSNSGNPIKESYQKLEDFNQLQKQSRKSDDQNLINLQIVSEGLQTIILLIRVNKEVQIYNLIGRSLLWVFIHRKPNQTLALFILYLLIQIFFLSHKSLFFKLVNSVLFVVFLLAIKLYFVAFIQLTIYKIVNILDKHTYSVTIFDLYFLSNDSFEICFHQFFTKLCLQYIHRSPIISFIIFVQDIFEIVFDSQFQIDFLIEQDRQEIFTQFFAISKYLPYVFDDIPYSMVIISPFNLEYIKSQKFSDCVNQLSGLVRANVFSLWPCTIASGTSWVVNIFARIILFLSHTQELLSLAPMSCQKLGRFNFWFTHTYFDQLQQITLAAILISINSQEQFLTSLKIIKLQKIQKQLTSLIFLAPQFLEKKSSFSQKSFLNTKFEKAEFFQDINNE